MKKKTIIVGMTSLSKVMRYYLQRDGWHVAAFAVNKEYIKSKQYEGLPVVAIEDLLSSYPTDNFNVLVTIGYKNMNINRKKVLILLEKMGYEIATYISPNANVDSNQIGKGTIIMDGVTIQPFVKVGCGNIFWTGATISHDSNIGNYNFFAQNTSIAGYVNVEDYCFWGNASSAKNGISVESYALIGAGTYVHCDVHVEEVVVPIRCTILNKKSSEIELD